MATDSRVIEVIRLLSGIVRTQLGVTGGHQAYLDLDRVDDLIADLEPGRALPRDLSEGTAPIDIDRWAGEGGAAHGDE